MGVAYHGDSPAWKGPEFGGCIGSTMIGQDGVKVYLLADRSESLFGVVVFFALDDPWSFLCL